MIKGIAVVMFSILLLTQNAYAYLDPSAGSIVTQVLLGGIAGMALFIRMYWERIKLVFKTVPKPIAQSISHTHK